MRVRRLALAAMATSASVAVPGPAVAAPGLRSVFQDDQLLLRSGPRAREATLDELAGLGVDEVRILVGWGDVAPARRGPGFDGARAETYPAGAWDALDGAVTGVSAHGMRVLLTPTAPIPLWASRCARPTRTCRPDPAAFGRFVRALGARYRSVGDWGLWNEPNAHVRLTPQWARRGRRWVPESPALYRSLVRTALTALRATGHGGDRVLLGETAGVATGAPPAVARPMSTLDFVRELLCLPPVRGPGCRTFPRLAVTGFAHHPYVRGGSGSPLQAAAPGSLPIHRLGPLVSMLNAAARRGRVPPRLPLHLTEFGFQSFPPDRFLGLPLGLQAAFLNASEWIAWRDPRVASLAQYLLRDDLGEGGFQTGLRFHDGRPKPALAAYRLALWVVPASRGVLVWGHDRVRVAAGSRVGVQHRTTARSRWRTLANIPGGTAFQRRFGLVAGEWRLMRTEVDHAPVASRIAVSGG